MMRLKFCSGPKNGRTNEQGNSRSLICVMHLSMILYPDTFMYDAYINVPRCLTLMHVCIVHISIGGGIHNKSFILEQILLLLHKIRCFAKEMKRFDEIWPSYLTFEILKIPIIGSKIKVVVKSIYGYQNLSGEKYKSNEKRIFEFGVRLNPPH